MLRRVLLLVLLGSLWLATRPRSPRALADAPLLRDRSLTVVLPLVPSTLPGLDRLLAPFLLPTNILYEIAIVCPRSLAADARRKLRLALPNATDRYPRVSLYPQSGRTIHQASLELAARVTTRWVLLLDEHGLGQVAECYKTYLLHPRAFRLPVGPRGFVGSSPTWSQLSPSERVQPVAFLVPPFVVSSSLLAGAPLMSHTWPELGAHVAKSTRTSFGGLVIGADILDNIACHSGTESDSRLDHNTDAHTLADLGVLPPSPSGFFLLAFPHREDLENFVPATCKLLQQNYTVLTYLYDTRAELASFGLVNERNCTILHFQPPTGTSSLLDWLTSLGSVPDIVIGLDHQDLVSSTFSFILEQSPFLNTTLIRLPRRELPYTEWIGTLTLEQLRNWNVPEITLSVITNNRPHSLSRLLQSTQRTLFYGDKVNLRINMDQTSDPQTMRLVQEFEWLHGDVFLHHRVIHGGLLSAVVESWYPHCDDSYGLLLEDDIELSPLSYAWVKMGLLRYKYGKPSPSASQLFGISLYQQKIIELHPSGRQPFDARTLFRPMLLAKHFTPYLSQVPCSWGALYFPAPWREFHDYLSLRLSQRVLPINSAIVPGVRSNKWTRSWKKYFIELVYLRGYVMLYPNYDDFVSLSTNHLEVGSHVKDEPGEVYEQKKRMFLLPLMSLAGGLSSESGPGSSSPGDTTANWPRLLDLPGGTLPDWERLPVLDLVGEVSSMEVIQKRGEERRVELGVCSMDVTPLSPSIRDILC